ncbi:MAG: alpha/beta fold hydrolase, partial [Gammaproteobacteria bacterium]|nr:alpha/beta fold hydrolase [Gammaproteobacteria bacterium]
MRRIGISLLLVLLIMGCQPPFHVQSVVINEGFRKATRNPLTSESFSIYTEETLHRIPELTGVTAFSEWADIIAASPNVDQPAKYLALAELSMLQARRLEEEEPVSATSLHLLSAYFSYRYQTGVPSNAETLFPRIQLARDLYNVAVARYITENLKTSLLKRKNVVAALDFEFHIQPTQGAPYWPVDYFDAVLPVWNIEITRGLSRTYRRDGLGAPLIAIRENRGSEPIEKFYPPEGIFFPATAVMHFIDIEESDNGSKYVHVDLDLFNVFETDTVCINGAAVDLSADFSSPYALLGSRGQLRKLGRKGLINYKSAEEHRGIFLLEPYDPKKIPILMIHGLSSSPFAWRELTNEILGSPRLRKRYQIWHYMYPTGLPFLHSTRTLRLELNKLLAFLNTQDSGGAAPKLVVIGHSMGGLLGKALVTNANDAIWDVVFSVPPEKLNGTEEEVRVITEVLKFKHQPYIDRLILLATPNRGSDVADSFIGKIIKSILRLPETFKRPVFSIIEKNRENIKLGMESMIKRGGPTSIDALSPKNPILHALAEIPPEVPFHTVVGVAKEEKNS